MKLHPLAIALLLGACTAAPDGNNAAMTNDTAGAGGGPAEVPIQNGQPAPGTPPQQPSGGEPAPDTSGEIGFTASPAQVVQGGTVTLALDNGADQRIGYNLCTSTIVNSAGEPVETGRVCTMELRIIEPGESATYPYELPGDLRPGSYSFSTSVTRMDAGTQATVRTDSVEVTAN